MAQAARDPNYVPTIQGVSNADGTTPLTPYVDSATNRLLVSDNSSTASGTTFFIESGSVYVVNSATKPLQVTFSGSTSLSSSEGTNIGKVSLTGSVGLTSSSSNIGIVSVSGISGSVGLTSSSSTIGTVLISGSVGLGSSSSTIGNVGITSGSVGLSSSAGTNIGNIGVTGSVGLTSSTSNIGIVSVSGITGSVGLTSSSSTIGNVGVTGSVGLTSSSSTIGNVGVTGSPYIINSDTLPIKVINNANSTNGWTGTAYVGQASTNAVLVKSGSAQLGGYYIYNANAAARKVAFHDESAAPTAGGSAVVFAVLVPATSAANWASPTGLQFNKGLTFTMVTELVNSGSTAIAAGDLLMSLLYK